MTLRCAKEGADRCEGAKRGKPCHVATKANGILTAKLREHVIHNLPFAPRGKTALDLIPHAAILLLALAACKTTSSAESHSAATVEAKTDATATQTVTQRVEQGVETITTTTEEYLPEALALSQDGEQQDGGTSEQVGDLRPHAPTVRPRRVLVKRTVTVDHRDPVVAQTTTQAAQATETQTEAKGTQEAQTAHTAAPSAGCALGCGAGGTLVLVALAAVAWLSRRLWLPKL